MNVLELYLSMGLCNVQTFFRTQHVRGRIKNRQPDGMQQSSTVHR